MSLLQLVRVHVINPHDPLVFVKIFAYHWQKMGLVFFALDLGGLFSMPPLHLSELVP